jgi:hypothetical protein
MRTIVTLLFATLAVACGGTIETQRTDDPKAHAPEPAATTE